MGRVRIWCACAEHKGTWVTQSKSGELAALQQRDYATARLYGQAAEGGAEAQCSLACLHYNGHGGQKGLMEARRLLGLAALHCGSLPTATPLM